MAITGRCSCGGVAWAVEGDPIASALCHCNRCKRSNGSICSTNFIVPAHNFRETSGKAKAYVSKGPSGKDGSSCFCENCGSSLYVTSEAAPEIVIVKAGTMDDLSLLDSKFKPTLEMFCEEKLSFLPSMENVQSLPGGMR